MIILFFGKVDYSNFFCVFKALSYAQRAFEAVNVYAFSCQARIYGGEGAGVQLEG